jgi:hypothetical protein
MTKVEVVRVVSTHPPSQGAYVEINAADFDPLVHTLYVEGDAAAPPAQDKPRRGRPPKQPLTEATHGDR